MNTGPGGQYVLGGILLIPSLVAVNCAFVYVFPGLPIFPHTLFSSYFIFPLMYRSRSILDLVVSAHSQSWIVKMITSGTLFALVRSPS